MATRQAAVPGVSSPSCVLDRTRLRLVVECPQQLYESFAFALPAGMRGLPCPQRGVDVLRFEPVRACGGDVAGLPGYVAELDVADDEIALPLRCCRDRVR